MFSKSVSVGTTIAVGVASALTAGLIVSIGGVQAAPADDPVGQPRCHHTSDDRGRDPDRALECGRRRGVEHRHYLDGLLEQLGVTERVVLVVHDWGSGLGFDWANRHRDSVAGKPLPAGRQP